MSLFGPNSPRKTYDTFDEFIDAVLKAKKPYHGLTAPTPRDEAKLWIQAIVIAKGMYVEELSKLS